MQSQATVKREKKRLEQREWRRITVERGGTKLCECGCGTEIPAVRSSDGKPRRFADNHKLRAKPGDVKLDDRGYVFEYARDPESGCLGWSRQHRLVWERENGPIPEGFHVHHINGYKADNRLENLELLAPSEHREKHVRERWEGQERQCADIEHLRKQGSWASVSAEQVVEIRQRVGTGESQAKVAADLDIDPMKVHRIWTGKTWKCRVCAGQPPQAPHSPQPKRSRRRRGPPKTKILPVRVSDLEKSLIRQGADEAGLSVSEYIRRAALGDMLALPQSAEEPEAATESDDFAARVKRHQRTMPLRSAETLVRREEAKERARSAVAK